MTLGIAAALAAAVAIGLALGLLGGGGSILTVPVLVYLAGSEPKAAIAMSLAIVGASAAVGLIPHARRGNIRWRTGLIFGAAGMAGAYTGGRIGAFLPDAVLMGSFAVMMIATAVVMLRRPRTMPEHKRPATKRPIARIILEGTAVGLVTGLVGAGGGFLVVPALVVLGGLSMPAAVGTSLLVIALKSGAALAGYLATTTIDWTLTLSITALAIMGSLIGARMCHRINPHALRRAFGWFTITIGAGVLASTAVSHVG